jgi:hypothetical protein
MLPDEVLLVVFDFCMDEDQSTKKTTEAWQSLVHVCHRWRNVVFESPHRLNLRLVATNKTSVDALEVWPPFPLVVLNTACLTAGVNNIVAAVKRRSRVVKIELFGVNRLPLKKILPTMQEPFPELRDLRLWSDDEMLPNLPDSFLGQSAPRLVHLELHGIPFPGLPKLLSSATHLVHLLLNISHSGYLSPEAMVSALSTLTRLEQLQLVFQTPQYHPDTAIRRAPLPTRSVLPILTRFWFEGVCEYLDGLVTRIDAPQIIDLNITFFNQSVFDSPQCIYWQFISRIPTLNALEHARVVLENGLARVIFSSQTPGYGSLVVKIACDSEILGEQFSFLAQVCTSSLPPLSTTEDLYIYRADRRPAQAPFSRSRWQDDIEETLWLELLRPFTAVKHLYLSKEFAPLIVPALQELVGGRTTEVLPTLQTIFVEKLRPSGPVQEGIRQFVAMRQVTGHTVAVSRWDK